MGVENYDVIELVGEGSFGKVYKGRRKLTDQTVAMKFIMKHGKSDEDIHNLRQEIEILRKLKHENIIEMLDSFESPQEFCVVTEFAQGELFEILEDDKHLPEEQVQAIAKQLVRALHYLHSNRIIHRDMKPQNILIGAGSIVKLCDFGFTCAMSKNKGTPLYMAPELVREQPYNHAADLWSLGVILYELFVGQPPHTNSGYALVPHNVKDPVKYPDNMSSSFKNFLKGLLNKMPQNRLAWPALLEHPFVKDTTEELEAREKRSATAAEKGCIAAWRGEGDKIQTPGGKMTSSASSDDKCGISFQNAQSYISHSQAVCSPLNEEFPGFANADEVKQTGSQIIDGLENNSRTVKGALMIGQDIEALAHVLLPIKRCSQGSQNSSRDQDILNSNQSLRIFSNLVAAGAITSSVLLDEIIHEILVYTTFIVSIKSSELNELIAKSFSIINVLVDNVEHGIGGSYFRHWVAVTDIFSQVVSCSEDASGRVMFESIACVTVMLTRVNQGLKALFSTPALQEVSGPYKTAKQILDHAKTSGLVDQLCLCLASSGKSLISGSSNMVHSACEACQAIWLLIDASDFLSTKENAVSFLLNTMRNPARDEDRGGFVIWTESAKLVAAVTRALIRSKPVQVAIHYCVHQRLEASLYSGIQLLLRCCLQSKIVPGILCGLPSSLPVTTVVSGGGDRTVISEIFSLLSLCTSSKNKDPEAIETTNLKSKITDPNTLVLLSCHLLASVAQCLKATGRNSALFMLTESSKNQLCRLSILSHHCSSESENTSFTVQSASAMLALAAILSLESGASVGSSVFELAVPMIPKITKLYEYLKLPNSEIVSGPNGTNGALSDWHGLKDGCVGLLEVRLRSGGPSTIQQMCASNVPLLLINLLAKNQQIGFPSREEEVSAADQVGLSPLGVLWTVSSICQCLSRGAVSFRQLLLRSDHIKLFYDLICDMHLKLVRSCDGPGGGMDGGYYRDVINAIIELLAVPFVTVQNASGLPLATASLINRIILHMGSPGVKVGMEDRDMVKVIEEDLGKYIKILSEVGVFAKVVCFLRGTLVGVLPYNGGLIAYSDCRVTVEIHASKEEKTHDTQDKFTTISSVSNIYFMACGSGKLCDILSTELANNVKKLEKDKKKLVTIVEVERIVKKELSDFVKIKTLYPKLREGGVGGIFIGWAANKTYEAFSIFAEKNSIQVMWLKTTPDIPEATTDAGCSNSFVQLFKNCMDMDIFHPCKFKATIESGSGAPFVEPELLRLMAGDYEKSREEATIIALKAANFASLLSPSVGGPTKVRVFKHGENFIPAVCEETHEPLDVQVIDEMFSDQLILLKIHQSATGVTTDFEKIMSKRKGVACATFFFSKDSYRYYRVLTTLDAKHFLAELTSQSSVDEDGYFFVVDYRFMGDDIKLGAALCTQNVLRSI